MGLAAGVLSHGSSVARDSYTSAPPPASNSGLGAPGVQPPEWGPGVWPSQHPVAWRPGDPHLPFTSSCREEDPWAGVRLPVNPCVAGPRARSRSGRGWALGRPAPPRPVWGAPAGVLSGLPWPLGFLTVARAPERGVTSKAMSTHAEATRIASAQTWTQAWVSPAGPRPLGGSRCPSGPPPHSCHGSFCTPRSDRDT